MRRRSTGSAIPARVSVRTSSPSATSAESAPMSPEMMLTSVVLPLPERPKSAMTPGVGAAKLARSEKCARSRTTETRSMLLAAEPRPHAAHHQLRGQKAEQPEPEGQYREAQREFLSSRGLHRRIERERQRACHSRNVGREGDDGAEFPEPGRKCGHGSGEYSGQHQRQGDGEEAIHGSGAERARRLLESPIDVLERQADRAHHERKGHDGGGERRAGSGEGKLDPEVRAPPAPDRAAHAGEEP